VNISTLAQADIRHASLPEMMRIGFFRRDHDCLRFESLCPHLMIRLQKSLILGLLVCLAISQRANSQTLQGDHLTTQVAPRKAAKAGNLRGALTTDTIPKESPGLCFQPGIGWQRVPAGKPSGSGTPGCGTSSNIEATKSAAAEGLESSYAQHPGGKDEIGPGIKLEDVIAGNHGQATASGAASMNAGTLASLSGTSLFNPTSGAASGRRMMPLGSMPSGGTHRASGSEPGVSADQVKDLKSHAYVSPITVRRMMRNASDLQTRIKLQELQSKLSNKAHVSTVSAKGDQARKGRSKDHHVSTADPSSMSDGHGRAAYIARALSSHSYP
jgi:hypothetical protein